LSALACQRCEDVRVRAVRVIVAERVGLGHHSQPTCENRPKFATLVRPKWHSSVGEGTRRLADECKWLILKDLFGGRVGRVSQLDAHNCLKLHARTGSEYVGINHSPGRTGRSLLWQSAFRRTNVRWLAKSSANQRRASRGACRLPTAVGGAAADNPSATTLSGRRDELIAAVRKSAFHDTARQIELVYTSDVPSVACVLNTYSTAFRYASSDIDYGRGRPGRRHMCIHLCSIIMSDRVIADQLRARTPSDRVFAYACQSLTAAFSLPRTS
jgi:hypothetical protein